MEETTTSTIENVNNALNDRIAAVEERLAENEGNVASLAILTFFGICAISLSGLAIWTAIDNRKEKERELENRLDRVRSLAIENANIANDNNKIISRRERRLAKAIKLVGGKKIADIVPDIDDDDDVVLARKSAL